MPDTEMADHFLESVEHKKHEKVGLVFLGQTIRGSKAEIPRSTFKKAASQRKTSRFRSPY